MKGALVNVNIIKTAVKGIVMGNYRTLLIEHGGYLSFSKQWRRNILNEAAGTERRMLRRMATTSKVPIAPGLIRVGRQIHLPEKNKWIGKVAQYTS